MEGIHEAASIKQGQSQCCCGRPGRRWEHHWQSSCRPRFTLAAVFPGTKVHGGGDSQVGSNQPRSLQRLRSLCRCSTLLAWPSAPPGPFQMQARRVALALKQCTRQQEHCKTMGKPVLLMRLLALFQSSNVQALMRRLWLNLSSTGKMPMTGNVISCLWASLALS